MVWVSPPQPPPYMDIVAHLFPKIKSIMSQKKIQNNSKKTDDNQTWTGKVFSTDFGNLD